MVVLFSILGFLAYMFGFMIFSTAKSSIHEGVALITILNGTVFFVGAAIVNAINSSKKPSSEIVKDKSVQKVEPSLSDGSSETLIKVSKDVAIDSLNLGVVKKENSESNINYSLIEELKDKSLKVGFNSSFSLCELCNQASTGQLIGTHYVCNNCKATYL